MIEINYFTLKCALIVAKLDLCSLRKVLFCGSVPVEQPLCFSACTCFLLGQRGLELWGQVVRCCQRTSKGLGAVTPTVVGYITGLCVASRSDLR